ncbi:DivIVA domain-containing protein [Rubeoparvulum massiliense]|uniref:DivIVA domain-containing protein n=1 Tax=Rubeoparvulum massiliense TaxID=1631346 RepID=UPI00065E5D94|nr:DivIVA domain-containing protein [Rubeoparvulum massiliense]
MALTPLDIYNKEFSRGFRGYDMDDVDEFMDHLAKDYELLLKENKELEEKISGLEDRLSHFNNIEDSLSKSIIVAQETAEEVKTNARKEAQLIIKEAEKNADRIINEALVKAREITYEIEELKKRASVYRTRFRALLEAQLEMLNQHDWDELANASDNGKNLLDEE